MNKSAIRNGLSTLVAAGFVLQAAGCAPPGTDERPKVTSQKTVRVLKPEDVKITLGKSPAAASAPAAGGETPAADAESSNTP